MVRLKLKQKNNKLILMFVLLILMLSLLAILVFNPIASVKRKLGLKREQSMKKTPTYDGLKDITIIGGNGKYSLPVVVGSAKVNSDNSMTIKAEQGTRVKSIDNGIISYVGVHPIYGNVIEILHAKIKQEDIYAFYGYLERPINDDVIAVQYGQKIGEVGERGYIYFELRDKNHKVVNSYKYMDLSN